MSGVAGRIAADPAPAAPTVRVTRSRRPVRWVALAELVALLVLAWLPSAADPSVTDTLVNVFILLAIASMWNLLAGYAGLVSVGQQAFVGLGAYLVLVFAQAGWNPFATIPLAAIGCAVIALPISWLTFRLRGGSFAIATWVVADACAIIIGRFPSLGGGTGAALPGLDGIDPSFLSSATYWAALAVAAATVVVTYAVLRSRLGLVLTAVRDDEIGARSLGARVTLAKRIVYLVSAAGCGGAGAILVISQLNVQPASAFSVQWAAEMIFVTVIGGIGSIEGPIVGTILFFALQQALAGYGAWYLIVLGLVAIVVALWAPRGLWGLVASRLHVRLFPTGYWLWSGDAEPGAPRGSLPWRRRIARAAARGDALPDGKEAARASAAGNGTAADTSLGIPGATTGRSAR